MAIQYECRNREMITIAFEEDAYVALVLDARGKEVGRLEFNECDGGLKLVHAFLDTVNPKYKHQGIGRRILQLAKEMHSCRIFAEDHDGIQRDDGSHLTGDAPGFVRRMREEGLIEHSRQSRPDNDQ